MGKQNRRNRFEWRDNSEEEMRYFRATLHGKEWVYESQYKGEEFWTKHDPITLEDWQALRAKLWDRYQRKRVAWKLVEGVDKTIAKLEEE